MLLEDHQVDVVSLFPVDVAAAAARLGFDLSRAGVRPAHPAPGRLFSWLDREPRRHLYRDLYIARDVIAASRGYDLFFVQHFMSLSPSRAARNVLICQFPQYRLSWRQYAAMPRYWPWMALRYGLMSPELGSYQEIVCYSEYVREWIRRRWQVDSTVLHPPVAAAPAPPLAKQRVILSVGRFFARGYNKAHGVQIEAFRRLALEGWELHLAGSRHYENSEDRDYYDRLVEAAAGLPVHFHPDIAQAGLDQLLDRAAIFWHSAGHGQDLESAPEFAEHFGISTVEAMGRGAVPIVIAAGGQPEIVRDGVDGFTWRTVDELIEHTRLLAGDPALRERMAGAARQRALDFSPEAFRQGVRSLMARVSR